jgi:hypothetical protein
MEDLQNRLISIPCIKEKVEIGVQTAIRKQQLRLLVARSSNSESGLAQIVPQDWSIIWNHAYIVAVQNEADRRWYLPQSISSQRALFFRPLEEGFQERIEFRTLSNKICGDIRKNVSEWRFDDWKLVETFIVN